MDDTHNDSHDQFIGCSNSFNIYIYIYILIKDINFIKHKHKMRTHHEEELVQENKNSLQYWYLVFGEFYGYNIFVELCYLVWIEVYAYFLGCK